MHTAEAGACRAARVFIARNAFTASSELCHLTVRVWSEVRERSDYEATGAQCGTHAVVASEGAASVPRTRHTAASSAFATIVRVPTEEITHDSRRIC